jgi:ligand-binding SRPBCC domain-containing protein
MRNYTFTIQSAINADKATVWQHITQMKNVNAELMPYARMTCPKHLAAFGDNNVPLNQTLFKCVVLLFGFIPIDIHHLRFDKIDYGTAFYENSVTATHRYWKHTRTLTEHNGKTIVKDELHFSPRIPLLGPMLLWYIKKTFQNRHKKLKQYFN